MYVKAIYALISDREIVWRSVISNELALFYQPGEWVKPRLKGSRLFVYKDLFHALMNQKFRRILELPFTGVVLWWCEAYDARPIRPIREPTPAIARVFWDIYDNGVDGKIPKPYHFFSPPKGAMAAKMVKLRNLVMPDEIEAMINRVPVWYLDR